MLAGKLKLKKSKIEFLLIQSFTEWPAVFLHDVEVDLEDVDAGGEVQDGAAHHHRGHHDPQELESRGE